MLNSFLTISLILLFFIQESYQFHPSRTTGLVYNSQRIRHLAQNKHEQLYMRWGMKTDAPIPNTTPDGKLIRDTVPFEIRGVSLPLVIFSVGILLTGSSFVGYFGGSDGAISSLGFVYGIPIFLIGLSLWYGELPPVEVITSEAGNRAWEKYASDTLRKVKQDVTRHRYGDNAHLDSTLDTLGLKLPQKKYPKLISITQEEASNGQLIFTLTFQSSETPFKVWTEPERVKRYSKFFGPNVISEVVKVNSEERLVAIKLTTCSSEEFQQFLNSQDAVAIETLPTTNSSTRVEIEPTTDKATS